MSRAMIIGATSGLGLEFAWQLAGSGHDLVLVARNEQRIHAIAAQIEAVAGTAVACLAADVGDRAQVEKVARRLTDPVEPIDLLVNSASSSIRAPFLESDVEDYLAQVKSGIRATMVVCHAAGNAMRKRGHGAILNVSSVAGFHSATVSAASKGWLTLFTESLAAELAGSGVTATVLLPGFVHTEAHENAAVRADGIPRTTWLKAPYVVQQALKDCAAGEVVSVPCLGDGSGKLAKVTPHAVRRSLQTERVARVVSRVRSMRAQKAAMKPRRFRAPWGGDER